MFRISRIIPKLFVNSKRIHSIHRQFYSTYKREEITGSAKTLLSLLSETPNDVNHEEIMKEAQSYTNQETSLYVDSLVFSRLCYYKPSSSLWNAYLKRIDDKLVCYTTKKNADMPEDKSIYNIKVLAEISKSFVEANLVSQPLTVVLLDYMKTNRVTPTQTGIIDAILKYLVHSESSCDLPMLCDAVKEYATEITPRNLANLLYYLAKLGNKDEQMIQIASRILHNNIVKGMLTPFEKTLLVKTYSIMKHEHITFFDHISQELMHIFEHMDLGLYFNNSTLKNSTYIPGIGSNNFKPSGVLCNVLKCIHSEDYAQFDAIEFKGLDEQLYTCGQIVSILDSMIYIRIHHLETHFKKLIDSVIKHCFKTEILETFDAEQLRCCVSLLANCRKSVDDDILEFITRRMVQDYVSGNATNSQVTLFLKDLVKQTKKIVKVKSARNKIFHNSKFISPKWINRPLYLEQDLESESFNRSIMESLCTRICEKVHSFKLDDLASCLRSVAYLGFRNDDFYKIFIPFFREHLASLNHVSIANITQAFNKVEIKDQYFFYLLGKQHQLYLNEIDKHNQPYIKRIG